MDIPDIQEIEETLVIIENRDPHATSIEQFDRDHDSLLDMQERVAQVVISARALSAGDRRDHLVEVLDRIENAVQDNRSRSGAAGSNS